MTSTDSDEDTVSRVLAASRALLGIVARSMGDPLEQVTLPQFRALTILTTSGPRNRERI